MKLLKYVLLIFGILGVIAAIYNMIHEGTFSYIKTVFVGLLFILASFNLEIIMNWFKKPNPEI